MMFKLAAAYRLVARVGWPDLRRICLSFSSVAPQQWAVDDATDQSFAKTKGQSQFKPMAAFFSAAP
jgi:hypothetical protein